MAPPAPPLFSTTRETPRSRPILSASTRAAMSVVPPAAAGTTTVIGCVNEAVCALANDVATADANITAAVARRRVEASMGLSPDTGHFALCVETPDREHARACCSSFRPRAARYAGEMGCVDATARPAYVESAFAEVRVSVEKKGEKKGTDLFTRSNVGRVSNFRGAQGLLVAPDDRAATASDTRARLHPAHAY